jgi:hypothetical protein
LPPIFVVLSQVAISINLEQLFPFKMQGLHSQKFSYDLFFKVLSTYLQKLYKMFCYESS